MPSTRIATSSQDEGEVSSNLIDCTRKGQNGKCSVTWIPTWLSKKYPKHSGIVLFCVASEVSELREKQSKDPEQSQIFDELSSIFYADSNEPYGKRDNLREFGVKKADEDVY